MFDDEKIDFIESLPESDSILIIWIKLLTLAGKCNASGYIYLTENIPYTEDMLAHKFKRPLNVVRLALRTFTELQMIEVDEANHIRVVNWEKHQNIEGLEKIREQNRKRAAKHRDKNKLPEQKVTLQSRYGNALDIEEELDKEIDKEKEIKKQSAAVNPFVFYEQNFGAIGSLVQQDIITWESSVPTELIIEAMKIAVKANKRSWKYVESILQSWHKKGIRTLDAVLSEQEEFERQKGGQGHGGDRQMATRHAKQGKPSPFDGFKATSEPIQYSQQDTDGLL